MSTHKSHVRVNRIQEFDILRAGAMLYIVGFWHLSSYSPSLIAWKIQAASLMVHCCLGVFVFISGFLLAGKYACSSWREILQLYQRRFLRIYPMFLLALTGFALMGIIDWGTYAISAFLLNIVLRTPLLTLWFVSLIFILYIITPLYLRKYSLTRTIVLTTGLFVGFSLAYCFTPFFNAHLAQYTPVFAAGILAARTEAVLNAMRSMIVGGVSFVLLLICGYLFTVLKHTMAELVVIECTMFASIPVFFAGARMLSKVVSARVSHVLSYCAFAMYLLHRMTFELFVMLYQPTGLAPSLAYLMGVALPLTAVLSYGFQYVYDAVLNKVLYGPRATSAPPR